MRVNDDPISADIQHDAILSWHHGELNRHLKRGICLGDLASGLQTVARNARFLARGRVALKTAVDFSAVAGGGAP
jgi:hypothetical protein